ncbi:MAG: acyloxyacyl hydrolase [Alphaproteobacteria bacterium]|nr:acyloxyacyl hydrolase [Alphaproteobacteria bacterium]MCL2889662.1 acyloxyacyl hydrolase [Alphaproteobacteria bacterium]
MKKIILAIAMSFFVFSSAIADDASVFNPMFGGNRHQIHVMLGQGFDSGELILFKNANRPTPYYMLALTYSQPNTFFRLPGRQSINLIKTQGTGSRRAGDYDGRCLHGWPCEWYKYNSEIAMLSQDVVLWSPFAGKLYFGTGAGLGVQGRYNDRLNTKFLIGFRMFAGYRMTERWNTEIIMQHFSNGDTGTNNYVYDFYGIGVSYSF